MSGESSGLTGTEWDGRKLHVCGDEILAMMDSAGELPEEDREYLLDMTRSIRNQIRNAQPGPDRSKNPLPAEVAVWMKDRGLTDDIQALLDDQTGETLEDLLATMMLVVDRLEQELVRAHNDAKLIQLEQKSVTRYGSARIEVLERKVARALRKQVEEIQQNARLLDGFALMQKYNDPVLWFDVEEAREEAERCPKCGSSNLTYAELDDGGTPIGTSCQECRFDTMSSYARPVFWMPGVGEAKDKPEDYPELSFPDFGDD